MLTISNIEYSPEEVAQPFEKVSIAQFMNDMKKEYPVFKMNSQKLSTMYDDIKLPVRSTKGAAGYDFFSPFEFTLYPGDCILIPTGIRVDIRKDSWLMLCPKSGLGFKYSMKLTNTIGVDDADYYYSENEGHLFIKIEIPYVGESQHPENILFGKSLHSDYSSHILHVEKGQKFAQGIFLNYGITSDDNGVEKKIRDGGMGSSGKF